jgi:hypothetical protein
MNDVNDKMRDPANRDPITKAPGAHPVGVGVGAAVGGAAAGVGVAAAAATGAATGSVAGPAGTIIGAAVGAVVGGLAGKAVAEHYDPTVEDAYWRQRHTEEPYYETPYTYDDYAPAYRLGGEARGRYAGKRYDEVEGNLASDWEGVKGSSRLSWDRARLATRAAWGRMSD